VHRDLKPANILFSENDHALLADFGISLALEFGATTKVEYIQGTYQYMAPEQFHGEVSVKSDQYALGCIAYELVTGEKAIKADIPFNASPDMQRDIWRDCHENQIPEPPRNRLNTDLPKYAETAILRALEKNRFNRYSNVNDFITALRGTSTLTDVDLVKGSSLWLKEGNEHFRNKRYDEALKAYDRAIEIYPDDAKFYINKGNVLRELKRYIEALDAYKRALQVASQNNRDICYVNMGHVLCDLKSFDEALNMYDMAISTSPDKAIFYVHKANVFQEKNLYSASMAVYDRAIRYAENEFVAAKAYTGKGSALLKLKNYPEAFEAYREALKRNPRDVSIYLTQGHALWKSSFYQAALDVYEQGLKIDPYNTELLDRHNALKYRGRS
jgi:tetratricopeptide (TPR) repeat protein